KYKLIILILSIVIIIETFLLLKSKFYFKPKIAIVIDDWGYSLENLEYLEEIKYPLNIAILPNQLYSKQIIERLKSKNNLEFLLHLPLEPKEEEILTWEPYTITTKMSEDTIRDILKNAIEQLPYIKGVSNHMGSKATEDLRTMRIIFKEIKRRGLYFLDSFVSANSICEKLSKQMSIRFVKKDIFLDNYLNSAYIKDQIEKLKNKSLRDGLAIGIAHNRKVSLEVLKETLPKLSREGFKFVFLSELAKR
ncbi:MAG: divergent polysaccharide deacetylase family protein, partial [Candidatus Omnitrophica bacterium]|nr:divergent polysaccharide deacetylase family protein [Candidatus Omnitrophota bacterium]